MPDISGLAPFKTILSAEETVSPQRMEEVSTWLIEMGCRYVMCRGEGCDAWCDAVRCANPEIFDLGTMNAKDFVMTTGHRDESLKAVFWYAKRMAMSMVKDRIESNPEKASFPFPFTVRINTKRISGFNPYLCKTSSRMPCTIPPELK